ncbi:glycosyl hydrolase family 28 protein [Mucilaginibacter sabulilitoris]|uniref:Glycosyl hydrolase family 28 protein n=1 Tax=Mucilaginibacter sabulilitoris TaxID=1173583 RepID=A0ABZ0TXA5_9SPHI|nr:glycosyl hydrolase family 28 protein [Mucilaginibacter sabulilitoris]WPU96110.1 glycosyl hydrolase family 28 protein [Mucilaginibacter sabulilitoris]
MKKIFLFVLMIFNVCLYANAELITYKSPQGVVLNKDFKIAVKEPDHPEQSVPAYNASVTEVVDVSNKRQNTSFGYFDFSGKVEVTITFQNAPIQHVKIRPSTYGIIPRIVGNTIVFSLNEPRNISIEVNHDIFHNLQLFTNPIATEKPLKVDPNVIYYGPGFHQIGILKVPSNKTVYIDGGAIVQGQLLISRVENVHVIGRGILTQLSLINSADEQVSKKDPRQRNDQITIEYAKNVDINGLIILPHKYSILIGQSSGVTVSNIKSFSSEGNADGIDVFCSSDVLIDKVYMRNSDDCVAIYGHRWEYYGNTKNVTVQNSTLWADIAHPVLIGTHGDTLHPDTLEKIKFLNVDILDQHENQIDYQGCMALNAGDSNLLRDITFNNIRVDDIRKGQLVNIRVMYNQKYNTSPGRGIENIYFKDVTYRGDKASLSVIAGYDETRSIKNVLFENLKINGKVIADNMPGKPGFYKTGDMANIWVGEHVEGLRFIQTPGNSVDSPGSK